MKAVNKLKKSVPFDFLIEELSSTTSYYLLAIGLFADWLIRY